MKNLRTKFIYIIIHNKYNTSPDLNLQEFNNYFFVSTKKLSDFRNFQRIIGILYIFNFTKLQHSY